MADTLDQLAADIIDDMASFTEKVKILAKSSEWTAEQALDRLIQGFREMAAKRRAS